MALKNSKAEEKKLEPKLKTEVEKMDGMCIKFYILAFTGFPDRIVLMPGAQIWFVEMKSQGRRPSKRQLYVHKQLRRLGFRVRVISDYLLLDEFINEINGLYEI
jgi:hypothetical protein